MNRDFYQIAPVTVNKRSRKLAVDENDVPLDTIWRKLSSTDGEVVMPGDICVRYTRFESRIAVRC